MDYKIIAFIVLLCLSNTLSAQTDFRAGYIITNANDTIFGEIDYRGDILMGKLCKFKTNGNIVDYFPSEIAAYRFTDDGKYFVSKELNGSKIFLQFLMKGQINLYSFRGDDGNTHFFLEKEDMPLSELIYGEDIIVNEGGKLVMCRTKTHIGLLNFYMQDAPGLQPQIESLEKPSHDKLLKLAKNYHYAVCVEGEDCIVFEKKKPLFKLSIDAVIGVINYRNDDTQLYGGALCNIWLPKTNEKLYFRTGLLYTNACVSEYDNKNAVWKVPLMFEYIYPKSVIRPKAAYGLGLFFADGNLNRYSLGFMGGLNINIDQSLSFSLEYNIDFDPSGVPLIPGRFLSQAFLGGINIKF